jgi:hypothetical protein
MINQYEIIALNNGVASINDAGDAVDLKEGGLSLDTYGDFKVSLNYQIDDILDITKRNTSFSKTIKLPGTPTNNRFFKSIYDVNIDVVYFNPAKRIPVIVRVGASDVMTGYMQLMNINIDNQEITYEVSIAGSFKDIISTISDYNLDILDLSEYNHTRNKQTIIDSWDYDIYKWGSLQNVENKGEGYVYPYIINGNSDDIYDSAYIYDLYPAIYIKTIFDKIVKFAGYTYTSDFLDTEYFKKLIMPYAGDKIQITAEEEENRTVNIGSSDYAIEAFTPYRKNDTDWYYNNDDSWYTPFQRESGTVDDNGTELTFSDNDNQWYTDSPIPYNGKYTCATTGYYDIQAVCKLVPRYLRDNGNDIRWNDGEFEFRWQLILYRANGTSMVIDSSYDANDPNNVYGVILFSPSDGSNHNSPWTDFDAGQTIDANGTNILLEAGDVIRLRYGFRHPGALDWKGTDSRMYARLLIYQSIDGGFSKFSVTPTSNDSLGNDSINMNQILDSNIKMKDFFMDIVKMFNLVVQDNPNKIGDLIIEPRDDFFKSRQRVLNWDEELKLDNDSTVKITPMSELDAKSYLFTYKKDDDFYNKEYTSEVQRTYGDYEIAIQNDFSDRVNKMEIGFSPTPDASTYINGRVAPYFVEADGEEFKPKKVKRRILFYGGPIDCEGFRLKDFPDETGTLVTQYPYVGMWDHPTSPRYDLGFGRTDKIYWNSSIYPNNNLFEQFHKQTMQNIIDLNSKLLECTVHLTPKDIADFDFRDIVFLLGSYWRVNKIKDYNPVQTDRLTKVVLYKIIDLDVQAPTQVSVPTSNASCPTDMISKRTKRGWVTVSASGQEVTADCCKSVGGNFVNGVCVLKDFTNPHPVKPVGGIKPADKPYIHRGGLDVVAISDKNGPTTNQRNGTSRNSLGVTTIGKNNYVPPGSENSIIIGDDNTIAAGVTGSIIIGDGISATESGAFYLGDIKLDQTGNIVFTGIHIIDGGEDEVFDLGKTNLIDVIDGTVDDVRNPGGDSKARTIIDGDDTDPFGN